MNQYVQKVWLQINTAIKFWDKMFNNIFICMRIFLLLCIMYAYSRVQLKLYIFIADLLVTVCKWPVGGYRQLIHIQFTRRR